MSTTYHLVCDTCQCTLWIGQRGAGLTRPRVYTTQPQLQALNAFLVVHENHHLMFGFDGGFPVEGQGAPLRGEDYRDFQMSDIPDSLFVEWQLTDTEIAAIRDAIEY